MATMSAATEIANTGSDICRAPADLTPCLHRVLGYKNL